MNVKRFWEHVNKDGPLHSVLGTRCWEWTGKTDSWGYGWVYFTPTGKMQKAHRVAWYLVTGSWPTPCGLHKCDNRICVRKSHLFEGTRTDNAADCVAKGRNPKGSNNHSSRITTKDVKSIRTRYAAGESQTQLAEEFGIDRSAVSLLVNRKTWRHV